MRQEFTPQKNKMKQEQQQKQLKHITLYFLIRRNEGSGLA